MNPPLLPHVRSGETTSPPGDVVADVVGAGIPTAEVGTILIDTVAKSVFVTVGAAAAPDTWGRFRTAEAACTFLLMSM